MEATCFSLSTSNEDFTLLLNGEKLKEQNIPKYMAGSKWDANKKVLKQVYTGALRPHMEYASSSWTTAAKTNTGKLDKIQNAGLVLITGGIKTTQISAVEKQDQLHSLE